MALYSHFGVFRLSLTLVESTTDISSWIVVQCLLRSTLIYWICLEVLFASYRCLALKVFFGFDTKLSIQSLQKLLSFWLIIALAVPSTCQCVSISMIEQKPFPLTKFILFDFIPTGNILTNSFRNCTFEFIAERKL